MLSMKTMLNLVVFVALGMVGLVGCDGRQTAVIEPSPGSKVLSQEELDAANEARTAQMSGAASEMATRP